MAGFGVSVFSEINRLALLHNAVNLGQGAPNFDGPELVKEAAIAAIRAGKNQYCRSIGLPELCRAVARHEERFWGLAYDPETEIVSFVGATEAIFSAFQALVNPGDEVILFEPFYDSYLAAATMAGATVKAITLRGPEFLYDPAELEAAISSRTRLILVNTPQNPTGRVLSDDELSHIAALCRRHDLIALSDEVYEHLVFEGEHRSIAALPGMRERTIKISSTGKTFSLTGWKIGYACAPPPLAKALAAAHQFISFCQATPFQWAMATALEVGDEYYQDFLTHYRARRDRLCAGLEAAGFGLKAPEGTYFVLADIRPLGFNDADAFCQMLPERHGVAAVPTSSFYLEGGAGRREDGCRWVRFAFCKDEATIEEAVKRLAGVKRH